jgi:hypothetical protein
LGERGARPSATLDAMRLVRRAIGGTTYGRLPARGFLAESVLESSRVLSARRNHDEIQLFYPKFLPRTSRRSIVRLCRSRIISRGITSGMRPPGTPWRARCVTTRPCTRRGTAGSGGACTGSTWCAAAATAGGTRARAAGRRGRTGLSTRPTGRSRCRIGTPRRASPGVSSPPHKRSLRVSLAKKCHAGKPAWAGAPGEPARQRTLSENACLSVKGAPTVARPPLELDHPLGDAIETFVHREDAEQFIANVKRDDPQLASHLRVVEREIETGGENSTDVPAT